MAQQTAMHPQERTFSLEERLVVALVGMRFREFPVGEWSMINALEAAFQGHLHLIPGCKRMADVFPDWPSDWPDLEMEWEHLSQDDWRYLECWDDPATDRRWCRLQQPASKRLVRAFAKRDPRTVEALLKLGKELDTYLDWSG